MPVYSLILLLRFALPQAALTECSVPPHLARQSLSENTISAIDQIVERAAAEKKIPGAVILVSHQGRIIFEKAYGQRSLEPVVEPMSFDTVFDLASLTKAVATAPSIMLLVERGRLQLDDPAAKYIPAFGKRGKSKITIRQLLTHYSGLPADLRLSKRRRSSAKNILTGIYEVKPVAPPGNRFIYSDLGFVVLGKVVEKVSGKPLDLFASENFFTPLNMNSTTFHPLKLNQHLIAPTERLRGGGVMRGQVHDPLAATLGGVAGDAGLFSTAQDLGRFCQMLLGKGALDGVSVLAPATIQQMVSPQSPAGKDNIRGFGWDIDSTYSSVKGSHFSSQSFGHTGYTGTSLWIDPISESFLIILTNRVHPDGKGNVRELRTQIADIVGAALQEPGSLDIETAAGK
jgi:CubicO group peptidase (beta-lactamase class C family)